MILRFIWESLLHIPYCLVGCVFWHYIHKCCTHHEPNHVDCNHSPCRYEDDDFDMTGI